MNGAGSFVSQYVTVIFKLRHGSDTRHVQLTHLSNVFDNVWFLNRT
jgi:hypothetical protein